jgi:octaprenyl-diphosphate synthase
MAMYAMHLGSAFQLVDDLLDYSESSDTIGKNIGDDLAEGKPTLPLIHAMQHGNDTQRQVIRHAIEHGERDRIDDIITIINETGAINYTSQAALKEAEQAKSDLALLPESIYKEALSSLADFSVERHY